MAAARRQRKRGAVSERPPVHSPRRLLLDTHTWLWWYTGDRRLGRNALAVIKRADEVHFSVASAWEIAIKTSIGKLTFDGSIDLEQELERDSIGTLAITLAHAEGVSRLPKLHRDPFDRMLISQSRIEGLTLVTGDDQFARYGVSVIDARE